MVLTSNQRNTLVLGASFALMSGIAALYFAVAGLKLESIDLILRLSARIAFLMLLLIFVARPLQQMLRSPGTARLLRNRRLIGIAFAGVHLAHLGILVIKDRVVPDFDLLELANGPGMFIYLVILAMLVTSWNAAARAIGPKAWKVLHTAGLYILFVAFTQTQLPYPGQGWEAVNWWFIVLIAIALVIRLTAFLAARTKAQPR